MSDDGDLPLPHPRILRALRTDESPSPLDLLRRDLTTDGRWSPARPLADICGGADALLTLETPPARAPTDPLDDLDDTDPLEASLRRVLESITSYRFDAEHQAIIRRLFQIARIHPARPLERRSDPLRIAAAVAWIALVGNMEIGRQRGQFPADLLWYQLGVTSCADLGRTIADGLGMRAPEDDDPRSLPCRDIRLGDVALLHSSTRAWIIRQRDATARAIQQIERSRAEARPLQRRRGGLVELRGSELGVLAALKVQPEGRQRVMILLGSELDDPEQILALSVPDARRLVQLLTTALNGPPAAARAAG